MKKFILCLLAGSCFASEIKVDNSEKARGFGVLAEHYENGRQTPANEAYEFLMKYVASDASVLDVGCGTGLSTYPLIARFATVKGCDWDEKMLQYARAKAPGVFDQGSIYQLPYNAGQFDLVTAFSAFHWFCDDAAVQEISKVLKPRGIFFVYGKVENSSLDFGPVNAIIEETAGVKIVNARENYLPIETLVRNGFEIVEVNEIVVTEEYPIEQAIQRMKSRSIWHYVIKANKEEQTEEKLREYFEAKSENGTVQRITKIAQIVARKSL